MADFIDSHNDFFYPKSASGLDAVIRLQKIRKLMQQAYTEIKYVFPQQIKHGEIVDQLDSYIHESLTILNNVLQKKKS